LLFVDQFPRVGVIVRTEGLGVTIFKKHREVFWHVVGRWAGFKLFKRDPKIFALVAVGQFAVIIRGFKQKHWIAVKGLVIQPVDDAAGFEVLDGKAGFLFDFAGYAEAGRIARKSDSSRASFTTLWPPGKRPALPAFNAILD